MPGSILNAARFDVRARHVVLAVCWLLAHGSRSLPADPGVTSSSTPGHSLHGQSFSEGPRRRLPPTPGCGTIHFPVTTKVPAAQAFFDQGVGQLHGFWFWEAERSFRTVLHLDPDCVMAHWGLALANVQNESRGRQFIAKAAGKQLEAVTPRERAWIESVRKLFAEKKTDAERKARASEFVAALERIALDHPDDLEARAFLVGFVWSNKSRHGIQPTSPLAIDALAQQVLAKNPRHPIHHYLIHLWDKLRPAEALRSAAACGPAAPGIAHMWHMPGHTYSELQRWHDAAWQQEAASRVDHAWMARAHLFPDQIHNFAHNSEWLVRNLNHLGRARQAIAVSTNLIAMPRIPRSKEVKPEPVQKFEEAGSSWQHGRDRLFDTILRWELWDVAAKLAETPCLSPGDEFDDQWRREQLLALAGYGRGDTVAGHAAFERLLAIDRRLRDDRSAAAAAAETKARMAGKSAADISKAMADAMQPVTEKVERLVRPLTELRLRDHLARGRTDEAKKLVGQLGDLDKYRLVSVHLALGDAAKAVEIATALVKSEKRHLAPQALLCWVQWQAGRMQDAVKTFADVRTLAGHADDDLPALLRLAPVAAAAGVTGDWRMKPPAATDIGERLDLATLGPAAWQPWPAGEWTARTAADAPVTVASLRGRPHVLLLTLGKACAHCNEQLKAFADRGPAFTSAGLEVVVISTDTPADLRDTDGSLPFPVYSGADAEAFRRLDAWDDFEEKPLHATCFIDAAGRMRWQHVSYEPFMLPDFLIQEVARLSACAALEIGAEKQSRSPVRPTLRWQQRASLPDPVGVAGSFAGVSGTTVLVAGGANFPRQPPWAGGRKVWHDQVWEVAGAAEGWKPVGRLPRPLAYGVSATGPRGLICIGGSDEARHHVDCFSLRLVEGAVQVEPLPSLLQPVANACGAIVGDVLYVCGGTESPEATRPLAALWALDLAAVTAGWKKLEDCPGGPRMLATAAAMGDGLFICGGADLKPAVDRPERIYRRDAWLYRPVLGWNRLADAPQPIVAAPSPAPVLSSGEVVVVGGDTGEHAGFQPPEKHPGFSRRVLGYDPAHDRWRDLESAPVARVTVPTVRWQGQWLVPSGEERPGVRSPQVWSAQEVAAP